MKVVIVHLETATYRISVCKSSECVIQSVCAWNGTVLIVWLVSCLKPMSCMHINETTNIE